MPFLVRAGGGSRGTFVLIGCLLLAAVLARPVAGAPQSSSDAEAKSIERRENQAWQQAADLIVDTALVHLPDSRTANSPDERRALDYAHGVLLLNAQPKLQSNMDEARARLESVRQGSPNDDLGLRSLYYLARIAQYHTEQPDPAKAASLYADLIARAPDHPFAQLAVGRLATLRLFGDVAPEERRTRLTEIEAAAEHLSSPAARRDIHLVLFEANRCFTGDKEKMLHHLLEAEAAGLLRQQLVADTTMQIALLARDLGHLDIARSHYQKFLAEFQRDIRADMLAGQLRDLPATPAAPTLSADPSPTPAAP